MTPVADDCGAPMAQPAASAAAGADLVDQVTDLPTVPLLLDHMRHQLEASGYLAILSINIMQSVGAERLTGWKAFDNIIRDVGRFLASIKSSELRREDFVSEVMISGNAFVVLLAPPRSGVALQESQLLGIRDRLDGKLRRFLARRLPDGMSSDFDCFIGAGLVNNDPAMRPDRLIYRALDAAQADSTEEARRAGQRHSEGLREILASRLVKTVYQPLVDLSARSILGWEGLSRPSGGRFQSIDQVFKAADERHSLWALERLCRERALEGFAGLAGEGILFLNVEPDSIDDPQFRGERTLKLLEKARLTPDRVVLEMTEHSAVRDFTAFRQTLAYFRSVGFRLAIDDLGSGYSGLQSVAEIQPEFVKIDMSLVRDIDTRPIKRELVETITRFCIRAGIGVIAEGIERVEELTTLREAGVTLAQGYLFARPGAPPPQPDLTILDKQ